MPSNNWEMKVAEEKGLGCIGRVVKSAKPGETATKSHKQPRVNVSHFLFLKRVVVVSTCVHKRARTHPSTFSHPHCAARWAQTLAALTRLQFC